MRAAFVETLCALAEEDPRIVLLTSDLGFSVIEGFAERFPDRFYNTGVAEQNMIGLATGLAEAGFIPFAYSIATFASLRPYEFIRNGPILHSFPVRIVGIGGGFEYGTAGMTHYAIEDIGLMRIQPGITVVAPADHAQTRTALASTYAIPRPIYFRVGKDDVTTVPGLGGRFELGRVQLLGKGNDVLLVTMGSATTSVVGVAEELERLGIRAGVCVVSSFNPSPVDDLIAALDGVPLAVSVETHYLNGALGSFVCEVVAENGLPCRVIRRGIGATPEGRTGSEEFLLGQHGLTRDQLFRDIHSALVTSPK
jgi:transketolase